MSKNQPAIEVLARGLVVSDGHILFCRPSSLGYYYLPGGHVEFSESAEEAVRRELCEELGIETRPSGLRAITEECFVQAGRSRHEINLVFHMEHQLDHWSPVGSQESGIEFAWISARAIIDADVRPQSLKRWLVANLSLDWPSRTDWIPMPQLDDAQ